MIITNNHKTPLGIAPDVILQPGVPTPVHDWDRIKKVAVVGAWLKAGVLSEAATAPPSKLLPPDRDAIIARLKELGVSFHPQTGVVKLQEKLAEAEAKKAQDILHGSDTFPANIEIADGVTVQLGEIVAAAHAASSLSVDDWNALPAEEVDALLQAEVDKRKAKADA